MNADRHADRGAVQAVVSETAARLGRDPVDLEPLAHVIEPAVVDGFAAADAVAPDSELRFRYSGCRVRVTGDGTVHVAADAAD